MAVTTTNGYCTGDQLKTALGYELADNDAALTRAIDTASRAVDRWCNRRFYPDGSDTVRYFTPTRPSAPLKLGPHYLSADVVSVTEVATDETGDGVYNRVITGGYYLGPRTAAAEERGYEQLVPLQNATPWPAMCRPDSVRVTGIFGWPATPPEVVEATIIQASRLWKRREAPFGIASVDLEGTGIRLLSKLDADVEMLVAPLRRIAGVG